MMHRVQAPEKLPTMRKPVQPVAQEISQNQHQRSLCGDRPVMGPKRCVRGPGDVFRRQLDNGQGQRGRKRNLDNEQIDRILDNVPPIRRP